MVDKQKMMQGKIYLHNIVEHFSIIFFICQDKWKNARQYNFRFTGPSNLQCMVNTPLKENHNVSASAIFDKLPNSLCDNFFTDATENR